MDDTGIPGEPEHKTHDARLGLKIALGAMIAFGVVELISASWYNVVLRLFNSSSFHESGITDLVQGAITTLFSAAIVAAALGMLQASGGARAQAGVLARVAGVAMLASVAMTVVAWFLAPSSPPDGEAPLWFDALNIVNRVIGTLWPLLLLAAVDMMHLGRVRPVLLALVGTASFIASWSFFLYFRLMSPEDFNSALITALSLFTAVAGLTMIALVIFAGLLPALSGSDPPLPGSSTQDSKRSPSPFRGVGNIVVGLLFIGGGASGQVVLRGTDSSVGIAIVGGVLVIVGVVQIIIHQTRR